MASTHNTSNECEDSRIWHGETIYKIHMSVTNTGPLHSHTVYYLTLSTLVMIISFSTIVNPKTF